eukprot:TRINITY_DN5088_c0_g1_i10.p1 TRINITY_DN5088_c0_g1~~TRINITY_DN5088_c0_g1_i10.p1  ORF type:complete len:418 (+),score=52.08 TRINITY_DN5088_c0_g1_i10:285-1538(+)
MKALLLACFSSPIFGIATHSRFYWKITGPYIFKRKKSIPVDTLHYLYQSNNTIIMYQIYSGVFSDYSQLDDIVVSLHQQQVLTGLVALKFPPAKEVQDFVNILHNAGIRFVYFSPSNPMKTLAFGERLGLETDWNCYINLGAKVNQEPQELWHEKTRLPRGVENVRKHIDEVDNLPLLIQLFSGCTPSSTKEMIDIYQEHGDVVCHIGSSLRVENLAIFAKADISIAVSPMFPSRCQHQPVNPFLNTLGTHHHHHSSRPCHESISSRLTTLSAFLTFPEYVTYDDLLELMRECRHILTNIKQSLVFILASHYFLSMTLLISFCALSPPIMHGYQLLWLMWVIVPALSVSFLSSSTEPDIMYLMPAKKHGRDRRHFSLCCLLLDALWPDSLCCAVDICLYFMGLLAGRDVWFYLWVGG